MQTRTKESKKRLQFLIQLTAFTCLLLIVSTYAWFTSQKDVNVSNIRGKVEVAENLKISLDAKNWTQVIDLDSSDTSLTKVSGTDGIVYGTYDEKSGSHQKNRNHVPTEFLPVSTAGEVAAVSVSDTRKELIMLMGKYDANKTLSSIVRCDESKDSAGDAQYAGYYAFDIFLQNSSKDATKADILQLNSDAYAWVYRNHNGLGSLLANQITNTMYGDRTGDPESGLQNTIRVALAKYGSSTSTNTIPATANQDTVLSTSEGYDITAVSIWEPNANTHVDSIITNVGPLFTNNPFNNVSNTSLIHSEKTSDLFFTKTLKKSLLDGDAKLADVYNWDSNALAQPKTVQTTHDDTYAPYTKEGVKNLKDIGISSDGTETSQNNFILPPNSITKLRVYIYLEGQDPDCDNTASLGGGIEVNLGFTKGQTEGSMNRYNEMVKPSTDRNVVNMPASNLVQPWGTVQSGS